MDTLASRIEAAAAGPGVVTFVTGGKVDPVPYARLHEQACSVATALKGLGAEPGFTVGLLGPTTRPLVTAIQAVWLTGATLVVLPLPMRLAGLDRFAAQTRQLVKDADVDLVVVDPALAPFLSTEPGDPKVVLLSDLSTELATSFDRPPGDPERLAMLQFTSGSTSDPKGVMMLDRTLCANVSAAAIAAEIEPGTSKIVSWLPLYHDMGMVGLLMMPMSNGTDLVLGAPQDFMAAPIRWMEWISTFGGTATAGPNFSWALATRALKKAGSSLELAQLRIALNGAEPVDPTAMDRLVEAGAPSGFPPGAVFPCFGMAELMIAGTFPVPMTGLETDTVDLRALETERYAAPAAVGAGNSRRLVSLGKPVPGLEIRVVDPDRGSANGEREVGELQIRGTSVTPGYYQRPDVTAEHFDGDWLRTGDLAYLVGGELFMCGRIKDLIIVGGRNVFPDDVERAVADVEGVRAGNVIAFGVDAAGKEGVVVVAETRADDPAQLRRAVHEMVRGTIGLPPKDVVLVAPGTIPKTSSGKLQRSLCRQRYLGDELDAATVH